MQHKQGPLLFSPPQKKKKEEKKSHKSDQYVIYFKQCFLSLYYKRITVCLEVSVEFHEIYKIPKQFGPILSARFGTYIWQIKGFRSEKGMRSSVGFLSRAFFRSSMSSFISSNNNMSRNPHRNNFLLVCINLM